MIRAANSSDSTLDIVERNSRDRRMMVAACMAIFIWGSIDSLLGAILPDLVRRASLTNSLAADVSVLNGLGLVIASLSVGPVLDRWGKKSAFVPALLVIAAALFGLHWADTFVTIAALAFALGLGGSALVTAAQALVSDLHDAGRAAALNLLNFFFGFGAFVTPLARGPLDRLGGGMSGILWTLSAVCLVVSIFVSRLQFPAPVPSSAAAARPPLLREPLFWLPVSILFLYVGIETSIWFWQVVYWTRGFGTSASWARLGISLFAVAIMVGRLISQWVLRFLSPRALLISGTSGSLVGLLGMRLAPDFVSSLVCLVVAGMFMAVVFPTALGTVGTRFAAASGTPIGLAVTAGWLGAMTIRPVVGYVAERNTLAGGYWALIVAALMMALCGFALLVRTGSSSTSEAGNEAVLDRPI
ncbi:MAG: MFS transporter [Candidatus Acidiferrales bacterium]